MGAVTDKLDRLVDDQYRSQSLEDLTWQAQASKCPVCNIFPYLERNPQRPDATRYVVRCTWNDRHYPVISQGATKEEAIANWERAVENVPDEVRGAGWDWSRSEGIDYPKKPFKQWTGKIRSFHGAAEVILEKLRARGQITWEDVNE